MSTAIAYIIVFSSVYTFPGRHVADSYDGLRRDDRYGGMMAFLCGWAERGTEKKGDMAFCISDGYDDDRRCA